MLLADANWEFHFFLLQKIVEIRKEDERMGFPYHGEEEALG